MTTINILYSSPNAVSIPYKLGKDTSDPQMVAFSATHWVRFKPGTNLGLELAIWEKIAEHPDVKNLMELGELIPLVNSDDLDSVENYHGVNALYKGGIVNALEQPVPISPVQLLTTGGQPNLKTSSLNNAALIAENTAKQQKKRRIYATLEKEGHTIWTKDSEKLDNYQDEDSIENLQIDAQGVEVIEDAEEVQKLTEEISISAETVEPQNKTRIKKKL